MASLLFKIAVELCMVLHVTAAANQIDEDTLSRLRGLCVEEVKRLRGAVRLEDAVRFQNGADGSDHFEKPVSPCGQQAALRASYSVYCKARGCAEDR